MQKFILSCLWLIPTFLSAQVCDSSAALKLMETPRASFMHSPEGSLWWDGDDIHAHIIDPTLSSAPARVAFAGGLWYGAFDQSNNIYMRANTYEIGSNSSAFSPGPITSDFPNAAICDLFNRVWEVTGEI